MMTAEDRIKALTTELDLPGKPLSCKFRIHSKLIMDSWWKDVRWETNNCDVQLDSQTAEIPLQRTNDRFLMTWNSLLRASRTTDWYG
jgi:hypothetical protein